MRLPILSATLLIPLSGAFAAAGDLALHAFERKQLTGTYYSEGANAGDINGDGVMDAVYGPYWFEGPAFDKTREIYAPKPQNMEGYADNFFNWVRDFNNDGAADVFVVGFPGTPAYVYENPGKAGLDKHWKKHQVFESVSNESPQLVDIVGDGKPELVCTFKGGFGFATIDWDKPFEPWAFHKVSTEAAPERFGHGLGVGDVNGDGKQDILVANGWFEQPAKAPLTASWAFHKASFTNAYGGAEMYAYDVDGDGDNDIITSLAAHDFGLAWYEQVKGKDGSEPTFRMHLIMGSKPGQNRYGLVFSEPHSLALVDMDGDGLKDIVTGKTYYSHHKASPLWDAGAVIYWFRLARTDKGVDWIPHKADGEAGIGRQVSVVDLNADGLPDIVVGGMKGAHVLIHKATKVSEDAHRAAQPKPVAAPASEAPKGPAPTIDPKTGRVDGALEGEALKVQKATAGRTQVQSMAGFRDGRWSGGKQLLWIGAKPGDRLDLEIPSPYSGESDLVAALTMARDYAAIRIELDGKPLAGPLDLFNDPEVLNSGELPLGRVPASSGPHTLSVHIVGANPAAAKSYLMGIDYLRVRPAH